MTTVEKLIIEISHSMPGRLAFLKGKADRMPMTDAQREVVNRALAERRAYFKSPEWTAKMVRAI
jgi:hypothetical protein